MSSIQDIKINNFFVTKKLFSFIFLVKLFYLFNECFLKDLKSYFLLLFFVRFDFLLLNFYKLNSTIFFINFSQFYFYCLNFNFYNLKRDNISLNNFSSLINLNLMSFIFSELNFFPLSKNFLFIPLNFFLFSFFDFRLKFDYISFIYVRSYFAFYRAFKFNEYLLTFFSLNNLYYLLKFFKISYWSIKKIQKYYPLKLRRVYREALLFSRYLIFQFYYKDLFFNYINFPIVVNNYIYFNSFTRFLILLNSLSILFLFFHFYFYLYIFPLLLYFIYLSQLKSNLNIFIFYYLSKFDFFFLEDIFFEFTSHFSTHISYFYSFFLNNIKLYFIGGIYRNSLNLNYLIINTFLNSKNSISPFFLNLNRFFYRINYLFFLNYISIFFFDHF
jgi:hypothetical protein